MGICVARAAAFFKLEDQRTGMLSGPRVTRQLEIPEPECPGLHGKCPPPKARVEAQTPSAPQSSNLWEVIGSWRSVLLNGLHHGWAHSLMQMFRGGKLCYEVQPSPPSSPSFSPLLLPFLHLPLPLPFLPSIGSAIRYPISFCLMAGLRAMES